jgi:hypothetical protein
MFRRNYYLTNKRIIKKFALKIGYNITGTADVRMELAAKDWIGEQWEHIWFGKL